MVKKIGLLEPSQVLWCQHNAVGRARHVFSHCSEVQKDCCAKPRLAHAHVGGGDSKRQIKQAERKCQPERKTTNSVLNIQTRHAACSSSGKRAATETQIPRSHFAITTASSRQAKCAGNDTCFFPMYAVHCSALVLVLPKVRHHSCASAPGLDKICCHSRKDAS